jgi:arylsulfatase A-like enzyme
VRAPSTAPAAAAKGVVLVVMSQLGLRSLAAYGGPLPTPEVSALASSGVVFESNLSSTGIASGSVGSMLTGLGARDLGLIDGDSRLPREVTTIADAVRQAGIASAFFSANPLTSPAFGFDRGWTHYEAHGPTDDVPAPRVFDAAVAWLDEHRKAPFLVVIHARGGHPPWDVPLERIKALPPENYTGGLEARHAGELLGKSLRAPGSYRFDDADRARGWALYGAAMEAEDAGLGRLMTLLRTTGLYDDTTVIVTADVGVNDAARVPFAESESLDEVALSTPLVVRFAHDAGKGAHVTAPTGGTDVARTVLAAFGLPSPATFGGRDLSDLVRNGPPAAPPSTLAVDRDRFALVWGSFVSSGLRDRETKLCDLSLEPGCVTDVRASYPLASRLLHAALYRRLVSAKPAFAREAAPLDIATQAALKAWGR